MWLQNWLHGFLKQKAKTAELSFCQLSFHRFSFFPQKFSESLLASQLHKQQSNFLGRVLEEEIYQKKLYNFFAYKTSQEFLPVWCLCVSPTPSPKPTPLPGGNWSTQQLAWLPDWQTTTVQTEYWPSQSLAVEFQWAELVKKAKQGRSLIHSFKIYFRGGQEFGFGPHHEKPGSVPAGMLLIQPEHIGR